MSDTGDIFADGRTGCGNPGNGDLDKESFISDKRESTTKSVEGLKK
ncbi:MAG: hypothetical protein KAI57_05020 [Candidatus Pacebacteria bacterium]|nr:hypothetical protein [Candidatus Paceibacterota bacterium]